MPDKVIIDGFICDGETQSYTRKEEYDGIKHTLVFIPYSLVDWQHRWSNLGGMLDARVEMEESHIANFSGKLTSITINQSVLRPSEVIIDIFESFDNKPRNVAEKVNRLEQIEDF
jgi:hypothetical protein